MKYAIKIILTGAALVVDQLSDAEPVDRARLVHLERTQQRKRLRERAGVFGNRADGFRGFPELRTLVARLLRKIERELHLHIRCQFDDAALAQWGNRERLPDPSQPGVTLVVGPFQVLGCS